MSCENIISEKYAIQKLGRTRNITFSNQFLIEFDIKVKGIQIGSLFFFKFKFVGF